MKFSFALATGAFATGVFATGALSVVSPAARAQNVLPPETTPPILVPLPAPKAALAPAPATKSRLTAIQIHNAPSGYIAWILDPAHNAPPSAQLAQFARDQKPQTPALNQFAANQRFDLLVQWIEIDGETLKRELPTWNVLGALGWTRIATPKERETLDTLSAARAIAPVRQRIFALDKSPRALSYLPLRPITEAPPVLREVPIPAIEPQPQADSLFAAPPYIPNFAEVNPMLPQMAPMPNSARNAQPQLPGAPFDLNVNPGAFTINPYLRAEPGGAGQMQGFKFQLTPSRGDDQTIALKLNRLSALPDAGSTVRMREGETAVFSLPDVISPTPDKARRTFLLVTPRVAPRATTQPRRDETTDASRVFRFIEPIPPVAAKP